MGPVSGFLTWLLLTTTQAILTTAASSARSCSQCCQRVAQEYPNQVIWTQSPEYPTYNARWTQNAQLGPTCIFLPTNANQVAVAITIFRSSDKQNEHCPFAVKSGGHMPHAGSNSIRDGIVLDLSWINETTISTDRSYVSLGSGNTWSRVYHQLNGTNLAVPGGRCSGTGVGGIALGGGYSWLTPKVGWVANNVLNYELVTASGEILDINKTFSSSPSSPPHHRDLFEALKGGGNNFGIVTRFDVATFEHNQKIQGGYIMLPGNETRRVLQGFDSFMKYGGEDENAALALEFVMQEVSEQDSILIWVTASDGLSEEHHPSLQPLLEMQPEAIASTYGPTTFADYPGSVPPVSRVLFATTTIKSTGNFSFQVLEDVHKISLHVHQKFKHIPSLIWDLQYEPMPKTYRDRGLARSGGNVPGLNYTTDDLVIVFLMVLWEDVEHDDEVSRAVQTWLDAVQEYLNVNDVGYPFEYLNYAAPFQDPLGSYGAHNLQFLRDVAGRYDPDGFFREALPGGFKLREGSVRYK